MTTKLNAPLLDAVDDTSATNASFWEMIQRAAKKFMHYVSLVCMFVLPSFFEERENGFAILYSILTAVSFFVLLGTAVQRFHIGSIKIWPKFLDVGTLAVNCGLLIYTQTSGKSSSDLSSFLQEWSNFVQNVALFGVVLVTLIVRMPFTLQIAKESVPESRWNSPVFILINYHVTIAWAVVFALQACLNLMGIYVYPKNYWLKLLAPFAVLMLGFKFSFMYPPYRRKQMLESKEAPV